MKLTQQEKEELKKGFKEKLNKYKTYTWEELAEFKRLGIGGQVCTCRIKIANTMTVECVNCGKIQSQYAKNYLKRNKNEK